MTAAVEKLGPNRVRLEVDVPRDRFQESIEKVYRGSRSRFVIDGFRRGKAPRAVIESHYGPGVFFDEAFDDLFPEVYTAALRESETVPVGPPENLQFLEADSGKGIRFTVEVTTFPEVTLGSYEGRHARRIHHTVTEEDINARLAQMQMENSRMEKTDDAAREGDVLAIDFVGRIDGEAFEGGSAEDQSLEIGSGRFIAGFEDQLKGARAGEEREVTVTFPEDYAKEELAGREAVFTVNVKEVGRRELPPLDDDFAEDVSEFDTLDELRTSLADSLQEEADRRSEAMVESELISQIVDDSEMEIPEVMIEQEVDDVVAHMRQQLLYAGLTLEQFLEMQESDLPSFRERQRPEAEKTLRTRLVIDKLLDTMKTMPDEAQLSELLDAFAEERGQDKETFRDTLTPQQMETFAYREGVQRMLEQLKDLSEIEEIEDTEAAAEKTQMKDEDTAANSGEKE